MTVLPLFLAAFTVVADQGLTETANEIIRHAGLRYAAVVFVFEPWREQGIVNAWSWRRQDTLIIGVSPILVDDLETDGIRAMLAHEVAHWQLTCGPKYRSFAEALDCEQRADALSIRWVGKRTVLRGLCQLIASTWSWRYATDVSDLIIRIKNVHEIAEGPP
ncbi:MAG TPA: M48 family metalloprotease [Candidatus Paceibacterota bacterium]|nr:M48 family metalloprotease [Candidatus Paceibacterota bacterium]